MSLVKITQNHEGKWFREGERRECIGREIKPKPVGDSAIVKVPFNSGGVFEQILERCPKGANAYSSRDATPRDWYKRQLRGRPCFHAESIDYYKVRSFR